MFHIDAVQAAGKIPVNVKELNADTLSLSGHKLHAPKGIGALYVREGSPLSPLLIGGGQENGRRAGTENVASIVGFGKACEIAGKRLREDMVHVTRLRERLESGLLKHFPSASINGFTAHRLPNTCSISFPGVEGEQILRILDKKGICASAGSACSAGSANPSHVLSAMAVPEDMINGSVRFSLSRYSTEAEVDEVIAALSSFPSLRNGNLN